jgi:hypothetical protein
MDDEAGRLLNDGHIVILEDDAQWDVLGLKPCRSWGREIHLDSLIAAQPVPGLFSVASHPDRS